MWTPLFRLALLPGGLLSLLADSHTQPLPEWLWLLRRYNVVLPDNYHDVLKHSCGTIASLQNDTHTLTHAHAQRTH